VGGGYVVGAEEGAVGHFSGGGRGEGGRGGDWDREGGLVRCGRWVGILW